MNTLNTDAKSANLVNLLFLSLLVLFVGAAIAKGTMWRVVTGHRLVLC